jgi:heme/copper-type cytochrome/quinol oxidase subunit 2
VLSRHAPPFREVSDGAVLEIYTLEAIRGRLLVGPYSRFGWHHPGPLYFYLQAPWYLASGLHTAGMQAGAVAINLTAFAVLAATLVRRAAAPLAASVSALLALFVLRVDTLLISPWNPHVIVLPMAAFIVCAAAVAADGSRAGLIGLVAIGSFLVQTHLAMAPIVAAMAAFVVAVRGRHLRGAGAGLLLAIALWIPPLLEQATHRPGNLASIVRFFARPAAGQPMAVAAAAWAGAVTAPFRADFALAIGLEAAPGGGWAIVVAGAALVLCAAVAWRRWTIDRFEACFAAASALAALVALGAATRIQESIVDHEIFWMSASGTLIAAVLLAAAFRAIRLRVSRSDAPVHPHAVATVMAWCMVLVAAGLGLQGMRVHVLHRGRTVDDHSVDALADGLAQYVERRHASRPLVRIEPQVWSVAAGALLRADKAGIGFAVEPRWVSMFGDRFAPTGREDVEVTVGGSMLQPVLVTP